MAGRGGRRNRKAGGDEQDAMADVLDALQQFDDFRTNVLPKLQELVKSGAKPEEIIKFGASMAAAKMVTHALTGEGTTSYQAAKDLLDRSLGKPKESVTHEHKLSKLKEEELDAVLLSGLEELEDRTKNSNH